MKLWTLLFTLPVFAAGLFAANRTPVVVELFTSEGCSSCPPADQLLLHLDAEQPFPGVEVIALSEHVDYWNRLGWRDPFSSADFTSRQQRYGRLFRTDNVYTPQMVVDGRAEFVGNDPRRAEKAIQAAALDPKVGVHVEAGPDRLRVAVDPLSKNAPADVLLVITERDLESNVTRGENSGRRLKHTAVVRRLTVLGKAGGQGFSAEAPLALDPTWKRSNLRAVVLVQDHSGGRILGAAAASL